MSLHLIWQVPLGVWTLCVALMVATDEDWGRAWTPKREFNEFVGMLALMPPLAVLFIVTAPYFLVHDAMRRKTEKGNRPNG